MMTDINEQIDHGGLEYLCAALAGQSRDELTRKASLMMHCGVRLRRLVRLAAVVGPVKTFELALEEFLRVTDERGGALFEPSEARTLAAAVPLVHIQLLEDTGGQQWAFDFQYAHSEAVWESRRAFEHEEEKSDSDGDEFSVTRADT
eukprot:EC800061.1.p2 GENE.EC800061.1~~EC800061.1.p2  ORF type:complete len:147 (+),score=34.12 EC800061.1:92-532(+)